VRAPRLPAVSLLALLLAAPALRAAVEDRINEAMPLPRALEYARSELLRLAGEAGVRAQVEAEFDAKLRVRAIDCAAGYAPGPFTSRQEIAAHFGATDCFERNDDALATWIGWRRAGLLVDMPPLRPIPPAPPAFLLASDSIQQVKSAASAGVALLWTYHALEVLDLGSGKRIARVDGMGGDLGGEVSPNGRVLTTSIPGGMALLDLETGESLARIQGIFPQDFAWLSPSRALIHRAAMNASFTVDFDSGTEHPLKFTRMPIDRVVPGTAPGEFLALSGVAALRIKVGAGRAEEPLTLLDQKPFRIQNWLRNPGVLTADGRYYVIAAEDLNFVATGTLVTTSVAVAPFEIRSVVPLPAADLILLSGDIPGLSSNISWRQYVYSLSRQSFAPLERAELEQGRIVYLANVRKLGLIAQNRVALLDSLPVKPALSHDDFVAALTREQEQQRSATAQQQRLPQISGSGPVRVETLPGARVTMLTSGEGWTVSTSPEAAGVEGIGIVQAANRIARPDGSSEGIVLVHVRRGGGAPFVLLLSSHEAVRWTLNIERGAALKAILTAGPQAAEVYGAGAIPVSHVSNTDASRTDTPDYARLQAEVARAAGSAIRRFQGVLVGSEFTVDGR